MARSLPDLSPFFSRYEVLVSQVDALFSTIKQQFPEEVLCTESCSSCCHAMFDLSLIEALYLNQKFLEAFPDPKERFVFTESADKADRRAVQIKRKLFKEAQSGKDDDAILMETARMNVRCPLLNGSDLCAIYEFRPITCRLYGVPTSIGGRGHTCGKTKFKAGTSYPTVNMDKIQDTLLQMSTELSASLGSAYKELHTMYVPVSTAILTTYDAKYLGIGGIPKEEKL